MIDYTELKADIESGDINERNIMCEIGKGGFMVSVLKWLSDIALGVGATLGANMLSILSLLQVRFNAPTISVIGTTVATGNGSVASGSRYVEIKASTDFTGTINGSTVNVAHFREFRFQSTQWDTLPAIPYTVSAGSLFITRIAPT